MTTKRKAITIVVEVCKYYPLLRGEGPTCGAGSEISDGLICTREHAERHCRWYAEEESRNHSKKGE